MSFFRSALMCYHDPEDPRPESRKIHAGGTVLEGIYMAIEKEPNNRWCVKVIQKNNKNINVFYNKNKTEQQQQTKNI